MAEESLCRAAPVTEDVCDTRKWYRRANRRSIDRTHPILNGPASDVQPGRGTVGLGLVSPAATLAPEMSPGRVVLLATALLGRTDSCRPGRSEAAIHRRVAANRVTSTARRPQPIGTTPAAIAVITGDDIRRAGVTTIADALLLADGVQVARFNNVTWAISPRGFNANTANKLRAPHSKCSCLRSSTRDRQR